jgi:hypothetical protein
MQYREDENNYPKAFMYTGIILGAFLVLSYFIIISSPRMEEGTGGILVNYGTTEEGMGTDYMSVEEPSVAEKANRTQPEKVTKAEATEQVSAEKSDQKVVTQNTEDAPEVVANDKKPSTNIATKTVKPETKPTVNQNALYTGKKNDGTGEGDGTGSTPGNQGKTTGTTLTNNYDGTGSGNGGNLTGMSQRNFVSRPNVSDNGRISGKIVVDIRVDRNGNVEYARAGARGTTISDAALLEKCENAVRNSKLNSLDTAPELQIGTVVFVFQVK